MSLLFCSLQSGKYLNPLEIAASQAANLGASSPQPSVYYQSFAKLCFFMQLRATGTQDSFLFFGAQT
jgi:hypothetical protein